MLLQAVPCLWFAVHGTRITLRDIAVTLAPPTLSAFAAGAVALAIDRGPVAGLPPWERIVVAGAAFGAVYAALLLGAFRKREQYGRILAELRRNGP